MLLTQLSLERKRFLFQWTLTEVSCSRSSGRAPGCAAESSVGCWTWRGQTAWRLWLLTMSDGGVWRRAGTGRCVQRRYLVVSSSLRLVRARRRQNDLLARSLAGWYKWRRHHVTGAMVIRFQSAVSAAPVLFFSYSHAIPRPGLDTAVVWTTHPRRVGDRAKLGPFKAERGPNDPSDVKETRECCKKWQPDGRFESRVEDTPYKPLSTMHALLRAKLCRLSQGVQNVSEKWTPLALDPLDDTLPVQLICVFIWSLRLF